MLRLAAVVLVAILTLPASAQDALSAKGLGKPPAGKTGGAATLMARRAAKLGAKRNLLGQISEMIGTSPDDPWLQKAFTITTDEGVKIEGGIEATASLPWREVAIALGNERRRAKKAEDAIAAAKAKQLQAQTLLTQVQTGLAAMKKENAEIKAKLEEMPAPAESGPAAPDGGLPIGIIAGVALIAALVGAAAGRSTAS